MEQGMQYTEIKYICFKIKIRDICNYVSRIYSTLYGTKGYTKTRTVEIEEII